MTAFKWYREQITHSTRNNFAIILNEIIIIIVNIIL